MIEVKRYKNWKEICEAMDWKTTRGNYKNARIKDLNSLCKYHREGNGFVIEEIYNIQKDRIDNRGQKAEYGEHIDKLIMHECSLSKDFGERENVLSLSPTRLFLKLNMINDNYSEFRTHINEVSRFYKIPYETIFDFYDSTYSRNKRLVESSLNRLKNKSLIFWQNEIKVALTNNVKRVATDEEKKIILNCETKAIEILGCESKKDVFLHKKWNEFRKIVKDLLIKENSMIEYYFNCYKINASDKFIKMILDSEILAENKNELNSKICEVTEKDAIKRQNKIKDKYKSDFGRNKIPIYNNEKNRLTNNYIEDTKVITRLCIDNVTGKVEIEWQNVKGGRYDFEESVMTDFQKECLDIENMFTIEDLDNIFG